MTILTFGVNRPTFEEGGFEIGDIPNQLDIHHTTGANWSGQLWNWTLGYQFLHSFQDNRQLERDNADFTNYMHVLSFAVQPLDTLNANLEHSWSDAASKETVVTRFTQSSSAGLEWRFWRGLILSGLYSYTDEDDSRKQAISRSYTLETQLAWQFEMPDPIGRRLPGRFFIRHALQSDVAKDRLMLFANDVEVWAVSAGVSLSVF